MAKFRPPAHFVPIAENENAWRTSVGSPQEGDRHDCYGRGAPEDGSEPRWSGRFVCTLTTETPTVIGGARRKTKQGSKDSYSVVEPYMERGRPAIPASTLRGLLSSIAEAASGSALRVLENRTPVSYRQPMRGALHAIGMLEQDPEAASGWRLIPLCVPLLRNNNGQPYFLSKLWKTAFSGFATIKVYVGNYGGNADHGSFLASSHIDNFSAIAGGGGWCYASPLNEFFVADSADTLLKELNAPSPRYQMRTRGTAIVAQRAKPSRISEQPPGIRGLLRILGKDGRDMPDNKRHELFIPFPEEYHDKARRLCVPAHVVDTFNALAWERSEMENQPVDDRTPEERKRLPYLPFDSTEREQASWTTGDPPAPILKDGDLVYFDIAKGAAGSEPVVSAIALSAIWRGAVSNEARIASMHDFFPEEHRPFNSRRTTVSPAERIFGFVSSDGDEAKGQGAAYAGRIAVSSGRLVGASDEVFDDSNADWTLPAPPGGPSFTRLKVLASPKPPSPTLYFHRSGAEGAAPDGKLQGIRKHDLKVRQHLPQGRKQYLHQVPTDTAEAGAQSQRWQWKTKRPAPTLAQPDTDDAAKQKSAVRPLKREVTFAFDVDFVNLTEREIDLLAYSLRPTEAYRHKIGMGKPLGLGSVRIDPVNLLRLDRRRRYASDDIFETERWHDVSDSGAASCASKIESGNGTAMRSPTIAMRAEGYREWAEQHWPRAIRALSLIGETWHAARGTPDGAFAHARADDIPVGFPPQRNGQVDDDEHESFKWFALNHADRAPDGQHNTPEGLRPISKADTSVPALRVAPWDER